jgi:hypothetical protein
MECFPGIAYKFFLKFLVTIPEAPIITGIEIQRLWNLKCMIIPVIIGATGIVTRSLRKNL